MTHYSQYLRGLFLVLALLLPSVFAPSAQAQADFCVLRAVFDQNADGVIQPSEDGASSVVAAITDVTGSLDKLITNADGNALVPESVQFPIRVDFSAGPGPGRHIGPAGPDLGLTSQFINNAGECGLGSIGAIGVYDPLGFCSSDPQLVTSCFVVADAPNHDDLAAIVSLRDSTTDNGSGDGQQPSDWLSQAYETRAKVGQVGAVHGLDVASDGTVYAAAFVKESARLRSTLNPNANPTALFVIPPGQDPELLVVVDPDAVDPRAGATSGFAGTVFTTGLGDVQLSGDEQLLFTVDLGRRELVAVDIATGQVVERTPLNGEALGIGDCAVDGTHPFGDLRSFGLGNAPDNTILVGVVCSAESTVRGEQFPVDGLAPGFPAGEPDALVGYVFEYDGQSFTPRLQWPLAGDRGRMQDSGLVSHDAAWHPWVSVYPFDAEFDAVAYPQPAITDLSVGPDGELVIAIGDRWGHQTAPLTAMAAWDRGTRQVAETLVSGDLQVACAVEQGWVIEGSANCFDQAGSEHFQDDRYGIHDETALGSVVHLPGRSEVVATHMDPVPGDNTWRSGGLIWHGIEDGRSRKGIRVYDGRNAAPDSTFEKGAGLGGLAVNCGGQPLQIGGHVWYDDDVDGRHVPQEMPISNVTVGLYHPDGEKLGTTTTDKYGGYYFDRDSLEAQLVAGQRYRVVLEPINITSGRSLSRSSDFFGLVARDESNPEDGQDDAAVYTGDKASWARLPSVEVVAGNHESTTDAGRVVNHTADFGLVDSYNLQVVATLVDLDLAEVRAQVQYAITNRGSVDSGPFEVTASLPTAVRVLSSSLQDWKLDSENDGTTNAVTWAIDSTDQLLPGETITIEAMLAMSDLSVERYEIGSSVQGPPGNSVASLGEVIVFGIGEIGGTFEIQDRPPGEAGGITLQLVDASDGLIATTVTDGNGFYSFSYLVPGDYRVRIEPSAFDDGGAIGPEFTSETQSNVIAINGDSPTGESIESPSSTADSASNLTVDFRASVPEKAKYKTWRGIVPAAVFGSLLCWFLFHRIRAALRRRS